MKMLSALAALPLMFVLAGCPVGHQSPPARAQETATELNVNTRFGRMEIAAESVAPAEREAFMTRRAGWGSSVRVADYEMVGLRMKGDADAETLVKVAWYRIDQGDLHSTTIRQIWHDYKGDWKLTDEQRAEGDVGLIGDHAPPSMNNTNNVATSTTTTTGASTPKRAQFPTIRLGEAPPEAPATIPPKEPTGDN